MAWVPPRQAVLPPAAQRLWWLAWEMGVDEDLVPLDVSHLFPPSTTRMAFRRGMWLRGFMFDFIQEFSPHLTRERVEAAIAAPDQESVDELFKDLRLPLY